MKSSKHKLSIKQKIKKPTPLSILSYQPNNFFVKIYASKITLNYLNKKNNRKKFETIKSKKSLPKISISKQNPLYSFNTHICPTNSVEISSSFINNTNNTNISYKDYHLHNKELYSGFLGKQKNAKGYAFQNYKINSNINKSVNVDLFKLNSNRNKFRRNNDSTSLSKKLISRKDNKKLSRISIIDSNTIDQTKTYPKNLTINYSISNNVLNKKLNLLKLQKIKTCTKKNLLEKIHHNYSSKLTKKKTGKQKSKINFETVFVPRKLNNQKLYKKTNSEREDNLFNILYNKIYFNNHSMILNDSSKKNNFKSYINNCNKQNESKRVYSFNKFYNIFNKFRSSSTNKSLKIKDITMIKKNSVKICLFSNNQNDREKSVTNKTIKLDKNKNFHKEIKKKFSRKINFFSLIGNNNKRKIDKRTNIEKINTKSKNDFFNINSILDGEVNDKKEIDKFDDMNEIIKRINFEKENKNEINIFSVSNENNCYNKYKEKYDKVFDADIIKKKKYNSANITKIKYNKNLGKIVEKNLTTKYISKLCPTKKK